MVHYFGSYQSLEFLLFGELFFLLPSCILHGLDQVVDKNPTLDPTSVESFVFSNSWLILVCGYLGQRCHSVARTRSVDIPPPCWYLY
jgi:hypothetical protein